MEGCPATWERLPIPDGPITVGIDGGYVRNWEAKKQQFEVIVGKSILAFRREDEEDIPSSKCFGFVQTLDTKPKRRLFEVLQSQGHQMNQQITFLSDGGDTVRDLQLYLNPQAEHLLDWFHLAMRLTAMQQTAKGLPQTIQDEEATYTLRDPVVHQLERLTWALWHGNVYKAFHKIAALAMDLDVAVVTTGDVTARKLLKAIEEFHTYICSGLQTVRDGLANKRLCRPALCANTPLDGPARCANGPTLVCKRLANTLLGQHAMRIGQAPYNQASARLCRLTPHKSPS